MGKCYSGVFLGLSYPNICPTKGYTVNIRIYGN